MKTSVLHINRNIISSSPALAGLGLTAGSRCRLQWVMAALAASGLTAVGVIDNSYFLKTSFPNVAGSLSGNEIIVQLLIQQSA